MAMNRIGEILLCIISRGIYINPNTGSQNLVYTSSMIAGATQVKPIQTADGQVIEAGDP